MHGAQGSGRDPEPLLPASFVGRGWHWGRLDVPVGGRQPDVWAICSIHFRAVQIHRRVDATTGCQGRYLASQSSVLHPPFLSPSTPLHLTYHISSPVLQHCTPIHSHKPFWDQEGSNMGGGKAQNCQYRREERLIPSRPSLCVLREGPGFLSTAGWGRTS